MHEVAVTFIERARAATDEPVGGFVQYGGFSFEGMMRVPRLISGIEVKGPFDATGVSRTASRQKIFICTPETSADERGCAERIAANLARRAFRRPVDDELLDLAGAGSLHDPDVLQQQARRMLADARSESLVTNFALKWLNLDELESGSARFTARSSGA